DMTAAVDSLATFQDLSVRVSRAGVIAIEPGIDITSYSGFHGSAPVGTFASGTLDPQGQYVANLSKCSLNFFTISTSYARPPFASTAGCFTLLAWSGSQERVACIASSSAGNTVEIVDLNEATAMAKPSPVGGTYTYLEGDAFERRRIFSATGNWFAF